MHTPISDQCLIKKATIVHIIMEILWYSDYAGVDPRGSTWRIPTLISRRQMIFLNFCHFLNKIMIHCSVNF